MTFFRPADHVVATIARLVLALMLMTVVIDGQSRPPAPGNRERERNPPQSQPASTQEQPADLRGTEQSPAVVRVLPVPKSQEEAAHEQAERESEATTKRWTIWLTALTVFVGVGQIYMIRRQAKIAEAQNVIMETQSNLMSGQLEATTSAANAAQTSAEAARVSAQTAATQLRLLYAPTLNIAEFANEPAGVKEGSVMALHLLLYYKLTNASANAIRIETIYKAFRFDRESAYAFDTPQVASRNLVSNEYLEITIDVGRLDSTREPEFKARGLLIDVRITIEMVHPIGGLIAHTFQRQIRCVEATQRIELLSQSDHEGWPQGLGPS